MLPFKRKLFLGMALATTFLVTACEPGTRFADVRYQTVGDVMETWIGSQESEVVASWGTPNGLFDNRDGSRVISWKNHRETRSSYGTCTQTFLVDRKGVIKKWGTSGFCPDFDKTVPKNKPMPHPTL